MHSRLFCFNDAATTQIYTLSLHDALPICTVAPATWQPPVNRSPSGWRATGLRSSGRRAIRKARSEEHTSELQSRGHLVCRLLLEKKNKTNDKHKTVTRANAISWRAS